MKFVSSANLFRNGNSAADGFLKVPSPMKFEKIVLAALLAGALAACSEVPIDGESKYPVETDLVTAPISEIQRIEPQGSDFSKALYAEYAALAATEASEGNYPTANRWSDKARQAAADKEVTPELSSRWNIPAESSDDLIAARTRLVRILVEGGKTEMPADAARAQAMHDCWVEESAQNKEPEDITRCKSAFLDLADKLEKGLGIGVAPPAPAPAPAPPPAAPTAAPAPEPPSRDYLVFFDFDKSNIRADAASVLDQVISAVAALKPSSIVAVGHADRAGSDNYNQALSERRAASVKAYLGDHGVATDTVKTAGRGESDPRVKTPDGVREQENRRVEIRLEE